MDYREWQIGEYVSELSSKAPVPGGGGVSALTGALAAGLSQMVCSLTEGKKRYIDVEDEIKEAAKSLKTVRERLLDCMEEDARAFEPLSYAYGLPKNTEEELRVREETLEKCLMEAALPPLHICQAVNELLPLILLTAEKGSKLAVSDAGCAAALAMAAFKAAALNVLINTRLMKNREKAKELEESLDKLTDETLLELEKIYLQVYTQLRDK